MAKTDAGGTAYIMMPVFIFEDKEISNGAKLLFGLILSLSCRYGFCYCTNGYFAKILHTSGRTVTRLIGELKARAWITVNYEVKHGGYRDMERRIRPDASNSDVEAFLSKHGHPCRGDMDRNDPQGSHPCRGDMEKNDPQGGHPCHGDMEKNDPQGSHPCRGDMEKNGDYNNKTNSSNKNECPEEEKNGMAMDFHLPDNIALSEGECVLLQEEFGENRLMDAVWKYSAWKKEKGAYAKSDYEVLYRWIRREWTSKACASERPDRDSGGLAVTEEDVARFCALTSEWGRQQDGR